MNKYKLFSLYKINHLTCLLWEPKLSSTHDVHVTPVNITEQILEVITKLRKPFQSNIHVFLVSTAEDLNSEIMLQLKRKFHEDTSYSRSENSNSVNLGQSTYRYML